MTVANDNRCSCDHEFCYVCGEDWKTCDCEQWDEPRLIARARSSVNRGAQLVAAARPAQRAAVVAPALDCDHDNWTRLRRGGACEECGGHVRALILVCNDCELEACRDCMLNMA
jgi:hypothetical protein